MAGQDILPQCARRREMTWDGRVSASVLSQKSVRGALPVVQLLVDGQRRPVLVDTGCTETIVHAHA